MISLSLVPKDLALLCRTSSVLLEMTRPILYREVKLLFSFDDTRTFEALNLLAANSELSKHVVSFRTPWPDDSPLLELLLEAIFKMSSLRKLKVDGLKFYQESQQTRFLEHFNSRTYPLREFSYESDSMEIFTGADFNLARLTSLTLFASLGECHHHSMEVWVVFNISLRVR